MKDAIEDTKNGSILHLKAKIGNKNKFPAGYDKWRKRIEIEVNEEPVKGKANARIIELIASYFKINKHDLEIVYGKKSKEKGILVKKKKEEIIQALENEEYIRDN